MDAVMLGCKDGLGRPAFRYADPGDALRIQRWLDIRVGAGVSTQSYHRHHQPAALSAADGGAALPLLPCGDADGSLAGEKSAARHPGEAHSTPAPARFPPPVAKGCGAAGADSHGADTFGADSHGADTGPRAKAGAAAVPGVVATGESDGDTSTDSDTDGAAAAAEAFVRAEADPEADPRADPGTGVAEAGSTLRAPGCPWLTGSPIAVPSERELVCEVFGRPIYRSLFVRKDHLSHASVSV
jgi:hypothetical protein